MKVTHRIEIECHCPADGLKDLYQVEIETERVIPVEEILALAEQSKELKIYQEELCLFWARRLNARVTMTGTHFGRVRTTVSA